MNVLPTTTPGTAVLSLRDPFPSRFPANLLALAYCRAVAADPQPPQTGEELTNTERARLDDARRA